MGFPLLLNKALPAFKNHKALKCGQEAWIWHFYKLHSFEEGPVQSGQVGFSLMLNKHCPASRSMIWTFVQDGLCGGMFRVCKWAFPFC